MTERQPPADIETEQALIACIFDKPANFGRVSRLVDADDFSEDIHRVIWSQCQALVQAGREITPITLRPYLPEGEVATGVTVQAYLARLAAYEVSTRHVEEYARTVRDLSQRRLIMSIGRDLVANACDAGPSTPPREIVQDAIAGLHDATREAGTGTSHGMRFYGDQVVEIATQRLQGKAAEVPSTGLIDLDQALGGGFRDGRLIIIAARPSMGKTAFLCSTARQAALKGAGVKVYALEIDGRENWSRIVADHLESHPEMGFQRIEYQRIMNGWLNYNEAEVVALAGREVAQLPIRIDDSSGLTMADIEVRTRIDMERMEREGSPLKVVMVDYLQLVKAAATYRGNRVEELGQIALAGKEMSKRLGVCVVMFSQLNRGVESRDDKRPQMSDLRGSGEIEEHADVVGFLYREAYYLQKSAEYQRGETGAISVFMEKEHDLEVILGKNRLGPSRTINAYCDVKFSTVRARAML